MPSEPPRLERADNNLYKQITKQYWPSTSLQTFGQMWTSRPTSSANRVLRSGAVPRAEQHRPNRRSDNHEMVQKQGCFEIAPLPNDNLASIRQIEKAQGLDTQ